MQIATSELWPQLELKARPHLIALGVFMLLLLNAVPASAAADLESFLLKVPPSDLISGATAYGDPEGSPKRAAVLEGQETVGYAYLNTDVVTATGYSGKPIHILVGLDVDGRIQSAKLVKHSEPIVLIGIPEKRISEFMSRYKGLSVNRIVENKQDVQTVDMISGATVTILVIEDSIFRSAVKIARSLGLAGLTPLVKKPKQIRSINLELTGRADWESLLGDGGVRKWRLSVGDVNQAFVEAGNAKAIARPEPGPDETPFIDLYMAPANVPFIGESLLGTAEYKLLAERLRPDQSAFLVFANGRYSFKGSGYVRGGLFERFQIIQAEVSHRFRDKNHKRIGDILAEGAPKFKEIGLFVLPEGTAFEPAEPWRLQLLVHRETGPIEKAFISFETGYLLPDKFVNIEEPKTVTSATEGQTTRSDGLEAGEVPLWQRIWQARMADVAILVIALLILTGAFFFQNLVVVHPRATSIFRKAFLLFTVVYIGFYAQAQLSVVNVFTFTGALLSGFQWEYFLMEPMIFVLWCAVAASLLFWGRGPYCGWLCPFGALQELLNNIAKACRVPQFEVPWAIHERAWPLKYLIFLGLFGLSIYSLVLAERFAEVEPFKTAIVLKFAREWPWVVYALTLLAIGLFIERFFCRYLCPLGAALAIPGRMRMFDWLKRYNDCGSPCQRCAQECMVQAIHPEGHINPNECLYCLHCQVLYVDDHRCPVMIEKRQRRERRKALSTKNTEPNSQAVAN